MKLTFMGTGTSTGVPAISCTCAVCRSDDPRNRRTRTSALLSSGAHRILLDCSIDFRQQALREQLSTLDAVLFTHGHADHVFGLDDIRMFNFIHGRPVPVYGNAGTLADLERTFWYVFAPTQRGGSKPQILRITLAVAGFGAEELEVSVEDGELTIRGKQREEQVRDYLHRGIATRQFKRSFHLARGVEVPAGSTSFRNAAASSAAPGISSRMIMDTNSGLMVARRWLNAVCPTSWAHTVMARIPSQPPASNPDSGWLVETASTATRTAHMP